MLYERRFAAARVTYYAEELAVAYVQVDAVQRPGGEGRFCRVCVSKIFYVYIPRAALFAAVRGQSGRG